jgi:ribonuclease P protein component
MAAPNKSVTLRNNQQFRKVYDLGKKFETTYFSLFILKTESCEHRHGITVTRKIGGAVVRNRCKRRIREVIRKYYEKTLDESFGYDLVVNVKSGILTAEFNQIEESFARVMNRFHKSALRGS